MKMQSVNMGMNKFCGPAVLSILTGKSTDHCAQVISQINGSYRIEGVKLDHLLRAANQLGFDQKAYDASGSLFLTLTRLVNDDGMYIVTVPNHFVVIEVNDRKIYFCDNHTKEPMPAASSARMLQRVLAIHKVTKRREPVELKCSVIAERIPATLTSDKIIIRISQVHTYDMPEHNKKIHIAMLRFNTEEDLKEFTDSMSKKESE